MRQRIGMVFQQFNLFPHLTVLRNLTIAQTRCSSARRAEAEKIARQNLERVGMAHKEPRTRRSSPAASSSASPSPGRCR